MGKMTRRDFLKIGFASAALTGLGGSLSSCFSPAPEVPRKIVRTAGKPITVASTCRLCPAGCGIVGEVADGRVPRIAGQPPTPEQPGKDLLPRPRRAEPPLRPGPAALPLKRSGARGRAVDPNHLGTGPGGNRQTIVAAPAKRKTDALSGGKGDRAGHKTLGP